MKKTYLIISLLVLFATVLDTPKASSVDTKKITLQGNISKKKYETASRYDQYLSEGLKHLTKNEHEKAIYLFQKAQKLFPNIPDAYINLAVVYINQNRLTEALTTLNKASQLASKKYPKNDILFYNLGLCYYMKGDYKNSAQYYLQTLKINSSFGEAVCGLELSYQNINESEQRSTTLVDLEHLFGKKQQITNAKKDSETLITKNNQYLTSMANQFLDEGSEYFENNDIDHSIKLLKRSIFLDPNNAESYYRLGVVYTYKNDFLKATECFTKAISHNPEFTKAYINLGGTYGKLQKYNKSLAILEKALKLDKTNPKTYYNIGMIYTATGKSKVAMKYFKKAKKLSVKTNNISLLKKINKLYSK